MQTVARLNWFFATVSLTMVVWGCAQTGSLTDADQERDPFYQKAKKLADASDYRGASEFYEKALMNNPESAPAHFELGLAVHAVFFAPATRFRPLALGADDAAYPWSRGHG